MGGKNNRAVVLERLDKRDRDSFRHKAHEKPQTTEYNGRKR